MRFSFYSYSTEKYEARRDVEDQKQALSRSFQKKG